MDRFEVLMIATIVTAAWAYCFPILIGIVWIGALNHDLAMTRLLWIDVPSIPAVWLGTFLVARRVSR